MSLPPPTPIKTIVGLLAVASLGCSCAPAERTPASTAKAKVAATATETAAKPMQSQAKASAAALPDNVHPPANTKGPQPLSGPPRLVLFNPMKIPISPYRGYIIDEEGKRPDRSLWPDSCERKRSKRRPKVPAFGGSMDIPAPTRGYEDGCALSPPLAAGRYIVRIDSGFGGNNYAVATVTLPLSAPVPLHFANYADEKDNCTPQKARRAANILLRSVRSDKSLSVAALAGCRPAQAQCGPIQSETPIPPPTRCEIRLHGPLMRLSLPVTTNSPREITAWLDREAVYSRKPNLDATSASRVAVEGKSAFVIAEGTHARHQHGGKAARIGGVQLTIINPTDHPLSIEISGVDYLTDHSCKIPNTVRRSPKVTHVSSNSAPPGRSELKVGYEGQAAYQSHCDRFATRVKLKLGGKPTVVTSEHQVTRFEPLRRSD